MNPLEQGRFESLLDPLAWLLYRVRLALEEQPDERPPRWVRIAAAHTLPEDSPGRSLAREGVRALLSLASAVQELVLDLCELLEPVALPQAYTRAVLQLIQKLSSRAALASLIALLPSIGPVVDTVQQVLAKLMEVVDLVPTSADALFVGQQVFALLCVIQRPRDGDPFARACVDARASGKLRLLQWAFELPFTVRGLGPRWNPEGRQVEISRFGARWLFAADLRYFAPVARDAWRWEGEGSASVPVYRLFFNTAEPEIDKRTLDISELHSLLEERDYFDGRVDDATRCRFTSATATALGAFQRINGLDVSGELDNASLNALLGLNLAARTVRRAAPFDPELWDQACARAPIPPGSPFVTLHGRQILAIGALTQPVCGTIPLVNADADRPDEEAIAIVHPVEGLPWYACGVAPQGGEVRFNAPARSGWIRHQGEPDPVDRALPLREGFVALSSRPPDEATGAYQGGLRTEGCAGLGRFFFAGRHQAPWRAGARRPGEEKKPVFQPQQLAQGERLGLYQWVDLRPVLELRPPGSTLLVFARWVSRAGLAQPPARGRVVLALADTAAWESRGYQTRYSLEILRGDLRASAWFPEDPAALAKDRSGGDAVQAATRAAVDWRPQQTDPLRVPADGSCAALYVGLQASMGLPGEDADIYFEGLELVYNWVEEPETVEGEDAGSEPMDLDDVPADALSTEEVPAGEAAPSELEPDAASGPEVWVDEEPAEEEADPADEADEVDEPAGEEAADESPNTERWVEADEPASPDEEPDDEAPDGESPDDEAPEAADEDSSNIETWVGEDPAPEVES